MNSTKTSTPQQRTLSRSFPLRKLVLLGLMIQTACVFSCSRQEDNSVNPIVPSKSADGSGSSSSQAAGGVPEDTVLCRVYGDTLIVTHRDAYYQCCLESEILVHRSNHTLDIVEYDVGQPCDCMCTFDLTTTIIDLQPGTYTVQVWGELGQFYGKCLVEIPSGPRLSGVDPKRNSVAALNDSIVAVMQDDILLVTHYHAFYNCCFEIDVDFYQDGSILNFIELPGGDPCRCMCYFDITSGVVGLTPGAYVIRVWNEDQSVLFGETSIVIPPATALKLQPVPDEPPSPNRRWWYHWEQEGCKTLSKRNQFINMNSYRMRLNVHTQSITERRRALSFHSNCHEGYVEHILQD